MHEYWSSVEAGVAWVLSRAPSDPQIVVGDLRPTGGVGFTIRLEASRDRLQARVRSSVYWPRPVGRRARSRLLASGWSQVDGDLLFSWDHPVETVVEPRITEAIGVLDGDPDAVLFTTGEETEWLPNCAHALTFWDWKSPVPFGEFNAACALLLDAGWASIHFNEVETGGDHYGLVISGASVREEEAEAAWQLYYWEVPDDRAGMAAVDFSAADGYKVIHP